MAEDVLAQLQSEASADPEKAAQLRAMAYERLSADPNHPKAPLLRKILSALPKVNVGPNFQREGYLSGAKVEKQPGADFGAFELPTADEQLAAQYRPNEPTAKELARGAEFPSLPARAAAAMLSPSAHRQFVRGFSDIQNAGAAQKIADAAHARQGHGRPLASTEAEDMAAHPDVRLLGELGGFLVPGIGNLEMKGGGAVGGLVSNAGKGLLGKTASGALGGAIANEITMPLIAGGRAAVEGNNPLPTMLEEAKNPVNAIAGAVMGAPSGLARGIRETGQAGRDIRLVESHGGQASPFGPSGPIYDTPIMRNLEGTARDQGAVSRHVADNVLANIAEEDAALGKKYAADKAAAASAGFLEGKIDPTFVREQAERLISGVSLTTAERAAVKREVIDEIGRYPEGMTVDEFNDFRGKLGRVFGVGPGETPIGAVDQLRQSAKRTIDETEMGPINEAYSKGKGRIERMQSQLGLNPGSRPDVQARSLANTIDQRSGIERTAGIRSGAEGVPVSELSVQKFLDENPRYRELFDLPELLAAKERMTGGIEPEAGFHRRMGSALLHKNIEPALVGTYRLARPFERGAAPAALAARFLLSGGQQ